MSLFNSTADNGGSSELTSPRDEYKPLVPNRAETPRIGNGSSNGYTPLVIAPEGDDLKQAPPPKDLIVGNPRKPQPFPDIVQFSSSMYYASEQEGKITIGVMRIGQLSGLDTVKYRTIDGSAKAGEQYVAKAGEVAFEDGQSDYSFDIILLDDKKWTTTLEFKIELSDPDGCQLGIDFQVCRVKVINDNLFPSDVYSPQLKGNADVNGVNGAGLFWEFFQLTFWSEGVWWRTLLVLGFDQMHNVFTLYMLFVNIYIIDTIFNLKDSETEKDLIGGSREFTAVIVGIGLFAPLAVLHTWEICKVKMDLPGTVRTFIRTNLFRKYLNYNIKSRMAVPASEMQLSIMEEAADLANGYMSSLSLIRIVVKLLILTLFTLWQTPSAWFPILSMPTLMAIWGVRRNPMYMDACEEWDEARNRVVDFVQETCVAYDLISDYKQRPQVGDMFHGKLTDSLHTENAARVIETNNNWFTKWLGPLFAGFYLAAMAPLVLSGEQTLGRLLATLRIFGQVSEDFTDLYDQFIKVSGKISALRQVTTLLNMGTDLDHLKEDSEKRSEATIVARREAIEKSRKLQEKGETSSGLLSPCGTDLVPIKLMDVCFDYRGKHIVQNLSLSVAQGQMIAIEGNEASGKATFTKLLTETIFPTSGTIFIPMHLRILRVAQEPVILQRTAWGNLIFGRSDTEPDRVKQILQALDMPELLKCVERDLELLREGSQKEIEEETAEEDEWLHALPYTDKVKINLARGFIVNPEVLVLHRPLNAFHNDGYVSKILGAIKAHVKNRGLGLPDNDPAALQTRRPRTVFFTTETEEQASHADVTLTLERAHAGVSISYPSTRRSTSKSSKASPRDRDGSQSARGEQNENHEWKLEPEARRKPGFCDISFGWMKD
eukprot:gnl/TRDRNA2_/TRDRNA2_86945_c0_seq2.p1 gnl/TRDRNA2_/TRDRNA2_86945_c0~~gnl/TRDRNA2_/TRDRNA2_86945_c0_seq2.p1  ORF type:complete len:886 (-),score=158.08 gnl/TRDRNA2_/TRDRNA2_86945_c0_seq2:35-2692(-)